MTLRPIVLLVVVAIFTGCATQRQVANQRWKLAEARARVYVPGAPLNLRQLTAFIDPYLEISPGVKATNAAVVLYKSSLQTTNVVFTTNTDGEITGSGTNAVFVPCAIMLNTRVKTIFYVAPGSWGLYARAIAGTNQSAPSNIVTVDVK